MAEQRSNYDRFLDAFNNIHHHLCDEQKIPRATPFYEALDSFIEKRPRLQDLKELRPFADLRNFVVHNHKFNFPIIDPSDAAVELLERIQSRLESKEAAGQKFYKNVLTLSPQDSLMSVLNLVHSNDFSQFPIYVDKGYVGLLTENGLTRWLAGHVKSEDSLIDLGDHTVRDVLGLEESDNRARLIAADTPVDVVESMFADSPTLEAVIVTHSGKPHEKPIGIATTWDIARE